MAAPLGHCSSVQIRYPHRLYLLLIKYIITKRKRGQEDFSREKRTIQ